MSRSIKLTLSQVSDTEAIAFLDSAKGQDNRQFTLPWLDNQEWNVVFAYLEAFRQYQETWPQDSETINRAAELKLATKDGTPLLQRVKCIGSVLYKSVFGDKEFEQFFQQALDKSSPSFQEVPVKIQHFSAT